MRAVVITRHGPPEVLVVQERPEPRPGPGEVVIDVRAAGINFADLMARIGMYPDAPKPPCVVGYEVAGEIAALGAGVDGDLRIGQRVVAATRFGGYAERAATRADGVVPLPDELTFEQGAAIPINYSTAWEALIRAANLDPGERVLIHAAAGGVGIAATQIAKRAGAEVWGTASPGKHDAIRGFGVDHPLDYTRSGWERAVPKLDVVMDALGGPSFRRSYKLLRAGGRLVCFGASGVVSGESRNLLAAAKTALRMPRFNLLKQMSDSKAVIGLNVLTLWDEFQSAERWRGPLSELLADGTIHPVVSESFAVRSGARGPPVHRRAAQRRQGGTGAVSGATTTAPATRPRALEATSMCEAFQLTAAARRDQVALRTIGDGISITFGEYARAGAPAGRGPARARGGPGRHGGADADQPARVSLAGHRGHAPWRHPVLDLQHLIRGADRLLARQRRQPCADRRGRVPATGSRGDRADPDGRAPDRARRCPGGRDHTRGARGRAAGRGL